MSAARTSISIVCHVLLRQVREPSGGAFRNPKHPRANGPTDAFPFPRNSLRIDQRAAYARVLKFNGVSLRLSQSCPLFARPRLRRAALRSHGLAQVLAIGTDARLKVETLAPSPTMTPRRAKLVTCVPEIPSQFAKTSPVTTLIFLCRAPQTLV